MNARAWILITVTLLVACRNEPSWTEYSSKDGGYRIAFPGKPEEKSKMEPMSIPPTPVHLALLDRGASGMLQVSRYEIHDQTSDPRVLLKLQCLHPLSDSRFNVASQRELTLGSAPGLSIVGAAPSTDTHPTAAWVEHRCYVIGKQMFHLTAIGPDTESNRREGARFLDSFALLQ